MAAAERDFRAVIKLIIAAAMIGTKKPRGETFVSAVIAEAWRQLPGILPIGADDGVALSEASAPDPPRARTLPREPQQTQCGGELPHQAPAIIGAATAPDLSVAKAARGNCTVNREPSPSLLCTSTSP